MSSWDELSKNCRTTWELLMFSLSATENRPHYSAVSSTFFKTVTWLFSFLAHFRLPSRKGHFANFLELDFQKSSNLDWILWIYSKKSKSQKNFNLEFFCKAVLIFSILEDDPCLCFYWKWLPTSWHKIWYGDIPVSSITLWLRLRTLTAPHSWLYILSIIKLEIRKIVIKYSTKINEKLYWIEDWWKIMNYV